MGLNGLVKGKEGEREIARTLNEIVDDCLRELGQPCQSVNSPRIQRNQNQSAVGGCDLVGTFGLAIEIKRQEQLSINTWWTQCVSSAGVLGYKPVLIFRQNTPGGGRKSWRVLTLVEVPVPGFDHVDCRAEIGFEDFKRWFRAWAIEHLRGELELLPYPQEVLDVSESAPVRIRLPDLYADS